MGHIFNGSYTEGHLNNIAFPLGGIGAGMICLEGNGSFSHVSVHHRPEIFNQPLMYGAISVRQNDIWKAKILQGKTPDWKVMFPWGETFNGSGGGGRNTTFGYPYFRDCQFESQFPFASVSLSDSEMPLEATLTGWSPFYPGHDDDSSLPMAVLEYTFNNKTSKSIDAVFTFAAENFMKQQQEKSCCCDTCSPSLSDHATLQTKNGFIFHQPKGSGLSSRQGDFAVIALEEAKVNCRWFRGGWFDHQSVLWRDIASGKTPENQPFESGEPSPGGSLTIPFQMEAGETKTIKLLLTWYVPYSNLFIGGEKPSEEKNPEAFYRPWYAGAYKDIYELSRWEHENMERLRKVSDQFRNDLFSKQLPPEVLEAVSANLSILKSPTVLRQTDGRLWSWEGCCDDIGCCDGSCTHVWNYAQALPHLFPDLERGLRQTEFNECQDERGHQNFRAFLPIRPTDHEQYAAADGQLGGIMKVHREWKISGDNNWLRKIWPKVKQSLYYCIETWDPDHLGLLVEPHHNTYDIEFWGPDGMCTSFYLGALKAASKIAKILGESDRLFNSLYKAGRNAMETELFNGEYFIQKVQTERLRAGSPQELIALTGGESLYKSEEAQALLLKEGPKYQYGEGCMADGVLGAWMAEVCGLGEILDSGKVKSHLLAVYNYNFCRNFHNHINPQRPTYALNEDSGLLLCTWPKGHKPTLPFPYSEEVWTGIEYQVAGHLAMMGEKRKSLEIVRAVRQRYDGKVRNPFDEYECGHWYARVMSSFALLQAFGVEL